MALCRVEDVGDLDGHAAFGWGWLLAAVVGAAGAWSARKNGRRAAWTGLGWAFLAFPALRLLLAVGPDLVRTFCAQGDLTIVIPGGAPLPAAPLRQLSDQFTFAIVGNLTYLIAGAGFWLTGRSPGWWRRPTMPSLAAGVAPLLPLAGRSETWSLGAGVALFPLLAAVNLLLLAFLPGEGESSAYFSGVTPYHAILIALAAGFAEELLFRGVMQQGLRKLGASLLRGRGGPWAAAGPAILLQAIPFAYAHASYNDLDQFAFAFGFAVLAGVAVETLGIGSAIALHVLIDFYAFVSQASDGSGFLGFGGLEPALAAATLLVSVAVLWLAGRWWWRVAHRLPGTAG